MYVCMYVCTVCMYILYVWMYTVYMYVQYALYVYVCLSVYVCMDVCTVCIYVLYVCMYVCMYVCTVCEIHMECERYLITPVNRDDLSNNMATLPYYSSKSR